VLDASQIIFWCSTGDCQPECLERKVKDWRQETGQMAPVIWLRVEGYEYSKLGRRGKIGLVGWCFEMQGALGLTVDVPGVLDVEDGLYIRD
jgi:hypothetical protein